MMPSTREPGHHDLLTMADGAVSAMEGLLADALAKVRGRVAVEGRIVARLFDREQRATHGLAWLATYVEGLRQFAAYADRVSAAGHLGEIEELVIRIGFGEYLAQIFGGIPMSQGEIARLADMGLTRNDVTGRMTAYVEALIANGNTPQRRARLVELLRAQHDSTPGTPGLDDTLEAIRDEMRKFAISDVTQHAQRWHLTNSYIPMDVIAHMTELGVFGLTIPEEYLGMGLGKQAMCVVAEELSRAYLGVGSLSTGSEIAADLVLHHGTEQQRRRWLTKIARGQVLAAVAFMETGSGSDLASIRTRAVQSGDSYSIQGSKCWITHAARADLFLLLVRTNPKETGQRGLSVLLAEKPRGRDERPFSAPGLSGREMSVTGFRGLKQYEVTFDGFQVPASGLIGGVEGAGFQQVMQTLERARIQTAARAVGVAQAALDQAIGYAAKRIQFGSPIIGFPRIADKIAMMATEISLARQLTYAAARRKDDGERLDVSAAMAKLLAARTAWAAADMAVQVHGANGVASESPISRILADARVFSFLEGSAEILAQLVARRLLEGAH
jgi:(2S)-methylsuccinyl-CoA dehydrogenase